MDHAVANTETASFTHVSAAIGKKATSCDQSDVTIFEHSFTLIGLVLGLALAELLSGLVRLVRTHGIKPLGLLTPMLAAHVIFDITTFWAILWTMRSELPDSIWPVLGFGIVLTCMYYVAASYVLPSASSDKIDLDAYYMSHRRLVLGIILACFVLLILLRSFEAGRLVGIDSVVICYVVATSLTLLAPGKWASIVGLAVLIVIDILTFVPQLVGL
jgi:hypothetical protein